MDSALVQLVTLDTFISTKKEVKKEERGKKIKS